ncbi:carbonic anhydrase [Nakamurella sp.]|uniref:carbonic anhydrase n=1 Tax=Nakamurella sp. TaxID=1869182 RepID=UPI0037830044
MRKSAVGIVLVAVSFTASGCAGSNQGSSGTTAPAASSASASASASESGSAFGSASVSAPPALSVWSYDGATGPEHWGDIAPGCATTPESTESPIDIEKGSLVPDSGTDVTLNYTPATFEVENNGRTIEAVPTDLEQNSIIIDGTTYYLQQFHFHTKSEHRINGATSPMEMHLVHKSDAGQIAVVGVLLDSGTASEPLAELFASIPPAENSSAPVELHHEIDVSKLVPSDPTLAQYDGSLTTPPCTEGVRWNVFLAPSTLSAEQIAAYTAVYDDTSRPVQPLNGRTVAQGSAGS